MHDINYCTVQTTVTYLYAGPLEGIFCEKATESSQEAVFFGSDGHFKYIFYFARVSWPGKKKRFEQPSSMVRSIV